MAGETTATKTRQSERSIRALISDGNHRPPAPRPAVGVLTSFPPGHAPDGRDGPPLSEEDAEAHVHGICFKTGPPGQVGVELEWLVRDRRDPALPVQADRITRAIASLTNGNAHAVLPGGGTLSTEPGGQLELSSAPATSLGGCVTAAGDDMAALRDAIGAAGLQLSGDGLDPIR